VACNSSKGTKKLSEWINSKYCKNKGINKNTVAQVVRKALNKNLEKRGTRVEKRG
jgi:hypothetical protein